jgi:arylsulfatase A-like enzyme
MDGCIGALRTTLAETGLERNTIFAFTADHGCHFKTRNTEYKRSPHDASIHIPLVIEGPGFNRGLQIPELVSQVDLLPSFLAAARLPLPSGVQGHSFLPLLERETERWRSEVFFEMSEFVTGRGLRTPQHTYAVMAPKERGWKSAPDAPRYVEYMMYDNFQDPAQQVNLAGRAPYAKTAEELRGRLAARMAEDAADNGVIEPCWFPYP